MAESRSTRRLAGAAITALMVAGGFVATQASADPIDTWEITNPGIDCVGDRFNPVRPDGTKDPLGDPEPGSPEWIERDSERLACDNQRDTDRRTQPPHVNAHSVARYGED
ncbi:MAG TPA: hypothetical protein VM618_05630, partial [Acidimicrobiia bacterium]|nr:hypothetical protein [Acidimicrobiia bacterium]